MKARLACVLLLASGWAFAGDAQEAVLAGYRAYLEGRFEDASASFKYLAALAVGGYETDANLAVVARDSGDNDAALALWLKSTLQEGADGLVWDQRGWSYMAAGRHKEAREAFLKAIDRSSTTATQAEANLGLGLLALARSDPKDGMAPLRSALVQGPYAMPAASYETALTALAMGNKQAALEYLRQGLSVDPLNLESLRLLARIYEKIGENRAAWRAYSRLSSLDQGDDEASARIKKLAQYIQGDPEASLAVRRLARPLVDPADQSGAVAPSTPTIRVAMFSDGSGAPATITQVYFMASSAFKLVAGNGETIKDDGRAYDQWEILYRPESNLIEVRDAARNIQYTTKTPFQIVPVERRGTVLLKSARFVETTGFDRGDREVRGLLEARPTPAGFKAVNEVPLEDYLYGAVGAAMPQNSPLEAYKAQAVVSRTMALWYKSQAAPNQEKSDICDSRKCQRYVGVNEEMREASKGVTETETLVLTTKDGRLARPMQHEHCGGHTETGLAAGEKTLEDLKGVQDGPGGAAMTPLQLERHLHEFPARERFCEAQSLTPPSDSRWIRLLELKDLQRRADAMKPIGPIRAIRVAKRTATGRVRALLVQGARGELTLEGMEAISAFLSPNSLRSLLFTIQPLGHSAPADYIVWGAGTGHGLGMCRAGAIGQAALGRKMVEILSVYFPSYGVESPTGRKPEPVERPAPKRPRNPYYKKP